jgi:hypothetical protein
LPKRKTGDPWGRLLRGKKSKEERLFFFEAYLPIIFIGSSEVA